MAVFRTCTTPVSSLRTLLHPELFSSCLRIVKSTHNNHDCFLVRLLHHKCSKKLKENLHCSQKTKYHTGSNKVLFSVDKQTAALFDHPGLDWVRITNVQNQDSIRDNIHNRKGVGDIDKLHDVLQKYGKTSHQAEDLVRIRKELTQLALDLPNSTHPDVPIGDESSAVTLRTVGSIPEFSFQPKTVVDLGEHLDMLRVKDVSLTTGDCTFYMKGALARLEQALTRFTIEYLRKKGFRLLSVPDLLYPEIIEGCGFKTTGENQVYKLKPEMYGKVCLSGTGEMPLAGFIMNQVNKLEDLPQRLMTVSQCYRAETSNVEEERGIYRVHHFTKVEMFGVTTESGTESQELLDEFIGIQIELFEQLGLTFRVLDMPTHELGAPAFRKYDIEAWMSGKGFWGEVSSASNCTDYQSRRLSAKYVDENGAERYCHTVNGTACAVPRMIMAIVESFQQQDKTVAIPEVLQPYMGGLQILTQQTNPKAIKPIKFTKKLKKAMKSDHVV